jgi:ppGpp synthetase/RelA/SpoT-type nucleotidyltranferase
MKIFVRTGEINMTGSIYGAFVPALKRVMEELSGNIKMYNKKKKAATGEAAYEHLSCRLKSDKSMREKCSRKGLPLTAESALRDIHDAIGIRMVCCFLDDIYENVANIKAIPGCVVVKEKDYIKHAKANGYRSYHMIISLAVPDEDVSGHRPGRFFAELQLRTIAMDSWASLEHQMKYKHDINNPEMIVRELKRCADELASCDVSMQTIRDLIRNEH